jgi:hypothetical protein
MQVKPIGIYCPMPFVAVVLTPEEYENHPANDSFTCISCTYLFTWNGRRWNAIDKRACYRLCFAYQASDRKASNSERGSTTGCLTYDS